MDVPHANPYLHTGEAAQAWETSETARLRNMSEFLEGITAEDLTPVVAGLQEERPGTALNMIDIGAGTGDTTEKFAADQSVDYYALDGNAGFLAARTTPEDRKIQGRSEALPVADRSFDLTYSRAVTAWNAEPKEAISEQLRATKLGGAAVFSEFDWSVSGADMDSPAFEAVMTARAIMMGALSKAGFKPEYGAVLGEQVDTVLNQMADADGLIFDREEIRHELPAGDYRELFLDAAGTLLEQLKRVSPPVADILEGCLHTIEKAETLSITLPAVVTQVVHRYDPDTLATSMVEPWIAQLEATPWPTTAQL